MIYKKTVQISTAYDELTKNYTTHEPADEDECFTGMPFINENVKFTNGASMRIKLNKVIFNKNKSNKATTQAELYINGKVVASVYEQSYYVGTWTLDYNNDKYIVEITTKKSYAKSKTAKIILFDLSKIPDMISDLLENYASCNSKSVNTDESLIDIIEDSAYDATKDSLENEQSVKNNPSELYLINKESTCDSYIGWCSKSKCVGSIQIRHYDSHQKWMLIEHDGKQDIQPMNFENIGHNVFIRKEP